MISLSNVKFCDLALKSRKSLHTRNFLNQFMKMKKTFKCDICNLVENYYNHSAWRKKNKCDIFELKYSLNMHIKVLHEGEKPFICDIAYTSWHNLNKHIKSIHKGKRYEYDICKNDLSQLNSVKIHIKKLHGTANTENKWK